ncbi:hypothetical protein PybrP1_007241 [[Pythium] brassicae (nom. inval.)]|nr:hypothetical protein PybrP1_007241 [[Pythium] brassicae (nom. inval.)]
MPLLLLVLRRPPLRRACTAAAAMGRRAFASHGMDAFMEFEREMALKKRLENPPPSRRERRAPLSPPEKPKDDECCKLDCPNCVLLVYQEKLLEYELSRLDSADVRAQPKPRKPEPTHRVRFLEPAELSDAERALLRENELAVFRIASNSLVSAPHRTKDDWWRSVRHIDLHVGARQKAYVGEDASNIAVFVPNDAAAVDRMLAHLRVDPDVLFAAETIASAADREAGAARPPLVPQPFAKTGSVREALTWSFDLVAPPRPGFLKSLAAFASDDRDIDALSMPNALDAFAATDSEHPPSVADVFDRFPSLRLSFAEFFDLAPRNAPRYYTVSSSRRFFPDRVSLTLGLKQRAAQPVPRCSSYLAALTPGQDAVRAAFFRSSFVFPRQDRRPILLVSAGTGIAPFRAFLQDLQHEREEEELEDASSHRSASLFYGCRSPALDFLYGDEVQDALAAGVLDRLHVEFSSNEHQPKRYVQDALAEQSAMVVEHLVRERGHVFVCGSLAMGRAVKRTIAAALQEHAARPRGHRSVLWFTKGAEQIDAATATLDHTTHESDEREVGVRQQLQSSQVQLAASGDSSFSSTSVADDENDANAQTGLLVALDSPASSLHSLSDTELLRGGQLSPAHPRFPRRRSTSSLDSSSPRSTYSTKRKGVKYSRDGAVVCCRFCDILRARDEDFLYEDELITVFRPLAPIVDSHILVVPRCHIRNVNMLTKDHLGLLARMKEVAARVLQQLPQTSPSEVPSTFSVPAPTTAASSDEGESAEFKFAFHTPPFNSIDHVHMHAFRRNEGSFGCFGSIKYRTKTWWCRSFQQVIARLARDSGNRLRRSPRRHRSKQSPQQEPSSCPTSDGDATSGSS